LSNSTLAWRRPVPGAVARPFVYGANPFRAGWHRGVDLAAPPGSAVRAACSGVVVTARPGVVTLRCGPWRVTHLPLGSLAVAVGASVRAGRVVGTVGASGEHRGLHLGVRRAGDRFAYVDPLPFLAGHTPAPPTVPPPRTTRIPRSGPGAPRPPAPVPVPPSPLAPVPASPPVVAPASLLAPSPLAPSPPAAAPALPPAFAPARVTPLHAAPSQEVRVSAPTGARALAPWPAWVGLALLLLGALGGGVRLHTRRAPASLPTTAPSAR
jgi:hypothetical protein